MVNDRHPSGDPAPTVPPPDASYPYDEGYGRQQGTAHGYAGYDGYSTGSFDNLGVTYGDVDPLFGAPVGGYDHGNSGSFNATRWDVTGQYDTIGYDTTAMWAASGHQLPTVIPTQQDADTGGPWDFTGWVSNATGQTESPAQWDATRGYDPTGQHAGTGQHGAYDTSGVGTGETQFWDTSAYPTVDESQYEQAGYEHTEADQVGGQAAFGQTRLATEAEPEPGAVAEREPDPDRAQDLDQQDEPDAMPPPSPRSPSPRRDGSRGRRRTNSSRPKRSALLTVAVPSVCALGVTVVAPASVSGMSGDKKDAPQAASDTVSPARAAAANSTVDSQLAEVRQGADDFRDRASRTQERIDLQARQAAEKQRRAEEAARKERLRPKFTLPVTQPGLSATFGQAGINWMSVHTGIDFPVSYGTPVMAATDGTVRTQWNDAYGNMVILTSPDGTETWYCHLSSAKIRSGSVKAGDTIAYSGNSGNSTGPHLHFEVHPSGGAAVDPLPWLRSHGLDPT